jgi:hypothetical protein
VAGGSGTEPEESTDAERVEPGRPSARPGSLRPSAAPPPPPPPNYRIAVAFAWVALQIVLIVTADRRPDGAFGFRMFAESASLRLVLYREVASGDHTVRLHVDGGVWNARGADAVVRRMSWYDRVPAPFWIFDQEMHASYGVATQLGRLQAALDDVSTHLPDDAETVRLVLSVTARRNGREPTTVQLMGPERHVEGGR